MPNYVLEEFDAYLKCGILAHGFLRLKCTDCAAEKIVAFSSKKRGFCPSCCAKRMAEAAHHIVENVLPDIPYRQFVVSFPIPMRYWLQTNRRLFAQIHRRMIRQIHRYYIDHAKAKGIKDPKPGSVSFTQRFGSALNLNVHCHVLCPDGVYTRVGERVRFRRLDPITDEEVAALVTNISQSILHYLKRQGYLDPHGEIVANPEVDKLFVEHEAVAQATAASISGRIAFGPNAGRK